MTGEMSQQFSEAKSRLDRVETQPMEEQKRTIQNLEAQLKTLEGALAV